MTYGQFTARATMLVMLGCSACNEPVDDADPSRVKQPILYGDAGADGDGSVGWLQAVPIVQRDGAVSLTSKPVPTQGDAGVASHGDAGEGDFDHQADAGQGDAGQDEPSADAGRIGRVRILVVDPSGSGLPDCDAVYYRDLDGDEYGDAAFSVTSCTQPAGYVLNGGDCYDQNERAYPGATGQFLQHRGDGSFDYDCDGVETQLHTEWAVCPGLKVTCPAEVPDCNGVAIDAAQNGGWTDFRAVPCKGAACGGASTKLPACGKSAYWGLAVTAVADGFTCSMPSEGSLRAQTCR